MDTLLLEETPLLDIPLKNSIPAPAKSLMDSSFIIKPIIGKPGSIVGIPLSYMKKKGEVEEEEESPVVVDVEDLSLIKASKKKFVSENYDAICAIDNKARRIIKERSFPFKGNKGERIVPNVQLNKLMRELGILELKRNKYIEKFIGEWEKVAEEGRIALKGLGDVHDYPSREEIRSQFTWKKILKGTEENFKLPKCIEMNPELFQKMAEETKERMRETIEHVTLCALEQAQDVLERLVKGLGSGEDKKFNTKYIDATKKVFDFLGSGGGNITNNPQLALICTQVNGLLDGESKEIVKRVKDNTGVFKERLTVSMEALKKKVEGLVEEHKGRVYSVSKKFDYKEEEL